MQKWWEAKEKTCFSKSFSQIKHDLVRQVPSKHWADVIFATITDHLSPRSTSRPHRADTWLVWMYEVISRSLLKNSSDRPTQHFASGWSNTRPLNRAKCETTHREELRTDWPTNVEAQQIITHPERKKENDWFLPQPLTWEMRLTDAIISGLKKALNEVNNYASFFFFVVFFQRQIITTCVTVSAIKTFQNEFKKREKMIQSWLFSSLVSDAGEERLQLSAVCVCVCVCVWWNWFEMHTDCNDSRNRADSAAWTGVVGIISDRIHS